MIFKELVEFDEGFLRIVKDFSGFFRIFWGILRGISEDFRDLIGFYEGFLGI